MIRIIFIALICLSALAAEDELKKDSISIESSGAQGILTELEVSLPSGEKATKLIKAYVDHVVSVLNNKNATRERLQENASFLNRKNLGKLLEHAKLTLSEFVENPMLSPKSRQDDMASLSDCIKKLNGILALDAAIKSSQEKAPAAGKENCSATENGPKQTTDTRRVTAEEEPRVIEVLNRLKARLEKKEFIEFLQVDCVLDPQPLPGDLKDLEKKVSESSNSYIALIKELAENRTNWFRKGDFLILFKARKSNGLEFNRIDLVLQKDGNWRCRLIEDSVEYAKSSFEGFLVK